MNLPVLVFDIESIPDVVGLRQLDPAFAALDDAAVYAAWRAQREARGQSDFMPLHLQRVLVISCVFRSGDVLRVHSFVDRDGQSEGRVIQSFFGSIDKHVPQLVSWNGGGFDLPVLHWRGLMHGVAADKYWDLGEDEVGEDRDEGQARELERQDRGGVGEREGPGEADPSRGAERADRGEQHEGERVRGLPEEQRRRQRQEGHEEALVEDDRRRALRGRHALDQHRDPGEGDGREQHQRWPQPDRHDARPQHDQHTAEPDRNGEPAPRMDLLEIGRAHV